MRSPLLRYSGALLALAAATGLRFFFGPPLGDAAPFVTFAGATVLVAWRFGLGPALLTVAGGVLIGGYWFVPPRGSIWPVHAQQAAYIGVFVAFNLLIITLFEQLKHSRQKAQQGEQRIQRLLNTGSFGAALVDQSGAIEYANSTLLDMLGYSAEEVAAGELRWDRITPPEDAHITQQVIRQVEATRAAAIPYPPYEKVYLAKDGRRIPVLVALVPFEKRPDGVGTGAIFVMDLTRMKQAEAALRSNEERLRIAAQTAAFGTFDIDLVSNSAYWSPEFKAILGLSPDQPVERDEDGVLRCIPSDDRGRVRQTLVESLDPEGTGDMQDEHRVVRSDGSVRYVLNRSKVFFSAEVPPRPLRRIGALIDITARKQLEDALRSSEERYRLLVENLNEGVWLVDAQGLTTFVNARMAELIDYRPPEILGKPQLQFVDPEDVETATRFFTRLRSGTREALDLRYRCRNGSCIDTRMASAPIFGPDGEYRGALSAVMDISDRKRVLEALLHANAELMQFTSVISHDLKAPLRAVHGLSSWIEEEIGDRLSPEGHHHMELLRDRVRTMDAQINALLEYARAGGQFGPAEPVAVGSLIEEIVDSLDVPAGFRIEIPDRLPRLAADRMQLRLVFANLIGNAVMHHDRPDGHVRVDARDLGTFFEFSVSDDGPGIPEIYQQRIFDMFQRGPAKVGNGIGIGLAVVRKVVGAAGGRVELDSAPGRGSTFRFTWPKALYPERC